MAEFGKGDPRWQVVDRVDGRNVNAWHWTERDCTKWCKNKITEKFKNIELCSLGGCKTEKVEKIEGDFTYCNRKRKHMFFYELEINIKWVANLEDKKIQGHIRIPSLTEDESITTTTIRVTTESKSKQGDQLTQLIKEEAIPKIRILLQEILEETKEHFKEPLPGEVEYKSLGNGAVHDSSVAPIPLAANAPYHKTVNMKLIFEASPELIYECLLDSEKLAAFTHSEATMDRTNGGEFSIFGGEIVGRNQELSPNQKIVQHWRFKSWPEGHHSDVTINLTFVGRETEVTLTQNQVPAYDYERTLKGWDQYFWSRINSTFGFNYRIL